MRLLFAVFLCLPAAAAQASPDCALPHDLADRLVELRTSTGERSADYTLRDAFSGGANVLTSKHFALKWGTTMPVDAGAAQAQIDRFELAWAAEVEDWAFDDPTGVDGTFFNVYIGDTGPEVPSVGEAGGYYSVDEEGYPFIVLGMPVLEDPDWADTVAAHEFFHAVQGATGAFWDFDVAGWYWEATANWAAGQVYPDGWSWAQSLAYYAFSPHYSVSTWANDGGTEPPNLHQYGAFIFPEYITEFVNPIAVRRSWSLGVSIDDPLLALEQALGEEDLGGVFADAAAHNIGWDYPRGDLFLQIVNMSVDWLGEWDNRIIEPEVDGQGWRSAPWSLEPQRFGSNAMELPNAALDGFTYEFEGDSVPWQHRLVYRMGSVWTYRGLEPGDEVEFEPSTVEAWLVLAAVPMEWTGGERFGWRARFRAFEEPEPTPTPTPTPEPTPEPDDDDVADDDDDDSFDNRRADLSAGGAGCSCSGGGGSAGGAAWLLLLGSLGLGRRKR